MARIAETRGWRGYNLVICDSQSAQAGYVGTCAAKTTAPVLIGLRGIHFHENPPPPARCYPSVASAGYGYFDPISACEESPGDSCRDQFGCGYYAIFEPILKRVVGMELPIWAHVLGLGPTILCQEDNTPWGFRCEQYRALRLFWPRDLSGRLLPAEHSIADYFSSLRWSTRTKPLSVKDCFVTIAETLAMDLVTDDLEKWHGWGGWEYREADTENSALAS